MFVYVVLFNQLCTIGTGLHIICVLQLLNFVVLAILPFIPREGVFRR